MKKLIVAAIIAIAGWMTAQAQSVPAPEKYNQLLEQTVLLEQPKAEFLMNATMETLAKDPKAYRQMMELAERRFSDAADPIHNEGLYLVVLKHATENYILSNTEKEKQRLLLEGAKKNMIGTVAADFDYITPGDKTAHRLKELQADHILVYFNNPDCESCETPKGLNPRHLSHFCEFYVLHKIYSMSYDRFYNRADGIRKTGRRGRRPLRRQPDRVCPVITDYIDYIIFIM